MMKYISKVLCFIIIFAMAISFSSCNKDEKKIDELSRQVSELQSKVDEKEEKSTTTEKSKEESDFEHDGTIETTGKKRAEETNTISREEPVSSKTNNKVTKEGTEKNTTVVTTVKLTSSSTTAARPTTTTKPTTTELPTETDSGYRLCLSMKKDIVSYLTAKGYIYDSSINSSGWIDANNIPTAFNECDYNVNWENVKKSVDAMLSVKDSKYTKFDILVWNTYRSSSDSAKTDYQIYWQK